MNCIFFLSCNTCTCIFLLIKPHSCHANVLFAVRRLLCPSVLPPPFLFLSLSPRWGWMLETVDSVLLLCCHFSHSLFFALSLNATCPVTWFIHSDRHRAGEPLSPPSISLSHSPSSPPSHFIIARSILRQELETQSCADGYQPIPALHWHFYLRVYQSPWF